MQTTNATQEINYPLLTLQPNTNRNIKYTMSQVNAQVDMIQVIKTCPYSASLNTMSLRFLLLQPNTNRYHDTKPRAIHQLLFRQQYIIRFVQYHVTSLSIITTQHKSLTEIHQTNKMACHRETVQVNYVSPEIKALKETSK